MGKSSFTRWDFFVEEKRTAHHTLQSDSASIVSITAGQSSCFAESSQQEMGPHWKNSGGSRWPPVQSSCEWIRTHYLEESPFPETNWSWNVSWSNPKSFISSFVWNRFANHTICWSLASASLSWVCAHRCLTTITTSSIGALWTSRGF